MVIRTARILFSLLFIGAGIFHFLAPAFFVEAMPEWLPFRLAITYVSGLAEICLGIALLLPAVRKKTGLLIAIFLLLIFPVNVYMAFTAEQYDIPEILLWLRLPLQFLLIWWVLAVSGNLFSKTK